MSRTFTMAPKTILGYRNDGRPIFNIAGGSDDAPEAPAGEPVVTIPVPAEPAAPAPAPTFTAEDIAKARKDEKDKLYPELQQLRDASKTFQAELDAIKAEKQAEVEAAAAKAREEAEEEARRRFEESDAKDLIKETEARFQQQIADMQRQAAEREALLQKEREFLNLQNYAQRRVAEESDKIAPQLLDYITGNTPEEIEQSIATAIAKTDAIVEDIAAVQRTQRSQMPGVSTAGHTAVGPLDNQPGQKSFSLEELQNMSAAEYAKHRGQLLGAASAQRDKGLFG